MLELLDRHSRQFIIKIKKRNKISVSNWEGYGTLRDTELLG